MTNEQKDWQKSLKAAQEALDNTDEEKYPKLHTTRKELVDTLQYNENMRIRAEKAENANKSKKPLETETPKKPLENETPKNDFSPKDYLALSQAGVPADDLDEVTDFAKYKGITIAEALKTSYIKSTLKEKAEERTTAAATNTNSGRRGTGKASGRELLKEFDKKGTVPESDADLDAMLEAEFKLKK